MILFTFMAIGAIFGAGLAAMYYHQQLQTVVTLRRQLAQAQASVKAAQNMVQTQRDMIQSWLPPAKGGDDAK